MYFCQSAINCAGSTGEDEPLELLEADVLGEYVECEGEEEELADVVVAVSLGDSSAFFELESGTHPVSAAAPNALKPNSTVRRDGAETTVGRGVIMVVPLFTMYCMYFYRGTAA